MKENHAVRLIVFLFILLSLAGFAACSADGTATLIINTGLGGGGRAIIGTPPSNIASISVTVSGPGMTNVNESFAPDTETIIVEVPSGAARKVLLLALVNASDPGTIISWGGTAITDLNAGETKSVWITMGIYETKIIVPDYLNERLVQANPTWTVLNGSQIGTPYTNYFRPYDVDLDDLGRIYIANNMSVTGAARLIRVDDITGVNLLQYSDTGNGVQAVAVDRVNRLVYYCTYNTVYQSDYSNSISEIVFTGDTSTNNFTGLAVDENGDLYIAGNYKPVGLPSYGNRAYKLHYNGEVWNMAAAFPPLSTMISAPFSNSNSPMDVLVKGNLVYVTNQDPWNELNETYPDYRILVLDRESMTLLEHYGTNIDSPDSSQNHYLGPERFVAILNKRITIIDEYPSFPNYGRLVSMDSINGDGWDVYGENGSGTGQFSFYYYAAC
jgi:hypothetical protein